MTDTKLTAGPEADALVAEAMGHEVQRGAAYLMRTTEHRIWSNLPRFTTTGYGMLAMMEWMDKHGWFMEISNGPWECTVGTGPDPEGFFRSHADTAPLAVAKALLAAVAATEETT